MRDTKVRPGEYDYLLQPPPPGAPEPPRRPQRIEIIIHVGKAPSPPGSPLGLLWVFVLALVLAVASVAHGQTISQYTQGTTTYYRGTDAGGQELTGLSWKQGGTTYTEMSLGGVTRRCSSFRLGSTTTTECH